jgi:phosphonate transport system substrate-binding protein
VTHQSHSGLVRYQLGVVPTRDDDATDGALRRLCTALGRELNALVLPFKATSHAALAHALESRAVQLAWCSPTMLTTEAERQAAVPFVSSVREGTDRYHAVLFSDAKGRYRSLRLLKGARAAWVARSSAAGYLLPRAALAESGLSPSGLFGSETFYYTHGAVADAVFEGRADVGATFAVFQGCDPGRPIVRAPFLGVEGREAHVLQVSGPIPSDYVAASSSLPAEHVDVFRRAFLDLHEQPALREAAETIFGTSRFATFTAASGAELTALLDSLAKAEPPSSRPREVGTPPLGTSLQNLKKRPPR